MTWPGTRTVGWTRRWLRYAAPRVERRSHEAGSTPPRSYPGRGGPVRPGTYLCPEVARGCRPGLCARDRPRVPGAYLCPPASLPCGHSLAPQFVCAPPSPLSTSMDAPGDPTSGSPAPSGRRGGQRRRRDHGYRRSRPSARPGQHHPRPSESSSSTLGSYGVGHVLLGFIAGPGREGSPGMGGLPPLGKPGGPVSPAA